MTTTAVPRRSPQPVFGMRSQPSGSMPVNGEPSAINPSHPTPVASVPTYGVTTMQSVHTSSWTTFAYASFGSAATMTAIGIWALPADLWVKGYLAMAMVFLVGACFTLAKTLRDDHEAKRLANRIEDAKTEKLLMEMNHR